MTQDRFIELFPIIAEVPALAAYRLHTRNDDTTIGGKVAWRLGKALAARWVWADGYLLTDHPVSPVQVEMALDILHQNDPQLLEPVTAIEEHPAWSSHPDARAAWIIQTALRDCEDAVTAALTTQSITTNLLRIEREATFRAWDVDGQPTLSIAIQSHVLLAHNLHEVIARRNAKLGTYIGWRVMDTCASSMIGTIAGTSGIAKSHRERLLSLTQRPEMQEIIARAPDTEPVFRVRKGIHEYEYMSSALGVVLDDDEASAAEFDIPPGMLARAVRLTPAERARLVKVISDILKERGIIGSAFNSRTHASLFNAFDPLPKVQFANNRARPFNPTTVGSELVTHKPYRLHMRWKSTPLHVAVINTREDTTEDFLEALRRLMEKEFSLRVNVTKERKIRVVTAKNIESALRQIEKDNPHVLLAFAEASTDTLPDTSIATVLKNWAPSRTIATQILTPQLIDDPQAMPALAMAILGKTGNIPYVLADPLEFTDLVVGLTILRERMSKSDRVSGLTRIYENNGALVTYLSHTLDLNHDEAIPHVLFHTLFPQELFAGKRVIVHHSGESTTHTREALQKCASVQKATYALVEVFDEGAPRLYGLEKFITQAGFGSYFQLNASTAFLVMTAPSIETTVQPLTIRVVMSGLAVRKAAQSVLWWSLLHYGGAGMLRLPVTLWASDDITESIRRHGLPKNPVGDTPFWL